MPVTRIRQLPHKHFCLPTHSHLHQPPPPNLHSSPGNLHTQNHATTKNHRVHSIACNLQHPSLHRPYIYFTPSKRKFGSQKAWNLIKTSHQGQTSMISHAKHEISLGNLTTAKKHEVSQGNLITISLLVTNHIRWLQWAIEVRSISRMLQHNLSTIFTSHHCHQPRPPTEPSNHNSMSSRHVKSFSTIHVDSFLARWHSQSTRKKRRRKNPDLNLPHPSTPPLYHVYITSPPFKNTTEP